MPLTDHFLRRYGRHYIHGVSELPPEVLKAFTEYDWPGNVRELENMVRRLCVLKDPTLVLDELRDGRAPASAPSLPTAYAGDDGVPPPTRSPEPEPVRPPPGSSVQVLEMPPRGGAAVPPPVPEVPISPAAPRYSNPFDIPQPPPPPPSMPLEEMSLKDIGKRAAMLAEREAILAMLQRTAWNKRKAASKLRISYKALLYKIKECGIVDPRANAEF